MRAYAGVPMSMYDAGDLRARMVWFLVPFALVLMAGCILLLIPTLIFGRGGAANLVGMTGACLGAEPLTAPDWFTMRDARRKAARSACVVTDQRAILLATSPS